MKLIDIGINLMHPSFDKDREPVIAAACATGVSPLIITGTGVASSRDAARYAAQYSARYAAPKLYATAGVHPHDAKSCDSDTIACLRELAKPAARSVVVAIGECGLDYNRDFSPRPVQREWFEKQIQLAAELDMPLFLHERDAFDDFSAILENAGPVVTRMVVHCFTGTERELEIYLELGAYIGITGWICDERRGRHLGELIRRIPADRLMIETDAPFLLPRDLSGGTPAHGSRPGRSGRNEPRFLPHIARVIAGHLGKDAEILAAETIANTRRFFGIPV
ncbi:preprotein translocase subunit TatD [Spirochaetia bacterium]|nr:preprotein translocase subunit TatD [Spirochaetia bacterium]